MGATASVCAEGVRTSAIGETRTLLEKWVETERILSREKRDLALAKEMLGERIALVEREIGTMREKLASVTDDIAEADIRRSEMLEENERLKQVSADLGRKLSSLETRTARLLGRLPDPIRDRVKPLSQQLPGNPGETALSLSERFQNVIGILNEVNKFNREITITSEIRTFEDGTSVEVTALYLGIGQGYYVGADATVAGVGRPSADSWVWERENEAAPAISRTIAILQNEEPASFVRMPLEIR